LLSKIKFDVVEYPNGYQYEHAKRLGVEQNAIVNGINGLRIRYKKHMPPKADEKINQ
jgi:hypothetical protein